VGDKDDLMQSIGGGEGREKSRRKGRIGGWEELVEHTAQEMITEGEKNVRQITEKLREGVVRRPRLWNSLH